jgi:hypothetical protein
MPKLADPRRERFARELVAGHPAEEAYARAGYVPNKGNAKLAQLKPRIVARVAELGGDPASGEDGSALAGILRRLDQDRAFAYEMKAPAVARAATMDMAKLLGLLNERLGLTDKNGGPVVISDAALARLIAFQLTKAGG